jgi:hypothetical protein
MNLNIFINIYNQVKEHIKKDILLLSLKNNFAAYTTHYKQECKNYETYTTNGSGSIGHMIYLILKPVNVLPHDMIKISEDLYNLTKKADNVRISKEVTELVSVVIDYEEFMKLYLDEILDKIWSELESLGYTIQKFDSAFIVRWKDV